MDLLKLEYTFGNEKNSVLCFLDPSTPETESTR